MTSEEAKEYVKDHIADYLASKGIKADLAGVQKFCCLNPQHQDHKPSMSIDPKSKKVHCFSCGAKFDTFDLVAIDNNVAMGSADAFKLAYEHFGLQVEKTTFKKQNHAKRVPEMTKTKKAADFASLQSWVNPDMTTAADAAHKALLADPKALQHFTSRGLDLDTIKQNRLGFCKGGCNAMLEGMPDEMKAKSFKAGLYQFIIPIFDKNGKCIWYQAEINDRNQCDEWNSKYKKPKTTEQYGGHRLWGGEILGGDEVPAATFVLEGEFDAMSIEQAAGHKKCAVALGGVNGVNRFLGLVKKHRPATTFILLMDNDKAGEGAMQKARAGLAELGAKFAEVQLKEAHDANELLQKDAEALKKFVAGCKAMAPSAEELAEEAATAYSAGFASSKVADFLEIMGGKGAVPPISTGIPQLDEALDGGLYSGLHILGAISSLGKTTFMLQLADSMAASGIDVLFFSLETPYTELMAKSISRSTFVNQKKMPKAYPQTARNVLCNRLQKHGKVLLEGDEKAATTQLLVQCIGEYANGAAKCIRFIDRQHSCGVQDIAEAIAEHRKYRPDRRLVVFVDYLQILAKASERYTDKQNTDEALKALSILAKNEKLPMLVISSINRTSYTEPIGLTSFKESGNIEYDAEVAIGLQYEGMDYEDDADSEETEKARKSRIRKLIKEQEAKGYKGEAQQIQLKVLKNRLAPKTKCSADFWPAYSFFDFGRGFSSTGSGDEDEADSWTV